VRRGEKAFLLLLPLATKHWNLSLAPKNGIFQGPPSNGTFHWPPSWDLPSLPSFSFLKGRIWIIGGSLFFGHNILFESCSTFERMEVSRDVLGA
jgi:hypothetical protein